MPGITYPITTTSSSSASERDRVKRHPSRAVSASARGSQYESHPQLSGYPHHQPHWSPSMPPPLIHHLSPYATIPLPALYPTRPSLHSLLTSPQLIWDVSYPPTTATCAGVDPRMHPSQWSSVPATDTPNVLSLTIMIRGFQTPIVVMPSRAGYISVYDVLLTVYHHLRREVSEARLLRGSGGSMDSLWQGTPPPAYGASAAGSGKDVVAKEVRAWMQRRTSWEGLVPRGSGLDEWELRTGPSMTR